MTIDFKALAQPFSRSCLKFKVQTYQQGNKNRGLAITYIEARTVMDRLDDVVGPGNWQDSYTEGQGVVTCHLSIRIEGEWITKTDVGSESDQKDLGDRVKAGYSDALKRAAVKWGIGRYLYRLPSYWVDVQNKQIKDKSQIKLPNWALPGGDQKPDRGIHSTSIPNTGPTIEELESKSLDSDGDGDQGESRESLRKKSIIDQIEATGLELYRNEATWNDFRAKQLSKNGFKDLEGMEFSKLEVMLEWLTNNLKDRQYHNN